MMMARPLFKRHATGCFSASVLLVAVWLPAAARADADLPESARLDAASVSAAVKAQAALVCKDSAADPVRWSWHALPLGTGSRAVLVGCVFAASNDIYMVLIERPDGLVAPARFGKAGARVANPRWDQQARILIDISGSGAGCAVERRWRWAQDRFQLAGQILHGCRR